MKKYTITLAIEKFDDGYGIRANIPNSDIIRRHFPTKDEMIDAIGTALSKKIDELEAKYQES